MWESRISIAPNPGNGGVPVTGGQTDGCDWQAEGNSNINKAISKAGYVSRIFSKKRLLELGEEQEEQQADGEQRPVQVIQCLRADELRRDVDGENGYCANQRQPPTKQFLVRQQRNRDD